jgi:hypothetical protein
VQITQLPYLGAIKGKVVAGRIHNISSGGMCVITPSALPEAALLRCDISIGETSIHIPTLAQVDRTEKQNILPNKFFSELSFLL